MGKEAQKCTVHETAWLGGKSGKVPIPIAGVVLEAKNWPELMPKKQAMK